MATDLHILSHRISYEEPAHCKMSSWVMSAFLLTVLVSAFWMAPVESVDCKRLCELSGAPRIGDCYCKIILFGSKRNSDSPSNSETVLTCDELCERSGAPA
ncbi:hypothetical protein CEXT_679081 [Caerostris extrusa]|uniref:Uncharacterized protein n=1 Tax=Caerostris extrusa TaxID=172846 RepID=A0AAV4SQ70_CAEEX|nr:hypothetical protein CEXT_679081 [Caerostris extrusa]